MIIGDGLFSFIKIAEQLKAAGAKQVDLYVTHLIASKGLDVLKGLVDNVYCYQTVGKLC
jgi:ribose-phosphate pyrophosphokinase